MAAISPRRAFFVFAAANVAAAFFSPIQDCDEVFNYWEPTHYLNHGHGFQTWEYSPEYAIRSWTYTGLHAVIIWLGQLLPFSTKVAEFYFLRVVLALFCALCETRLYSTISKTLHHRVAILFMTTLVFSPGMYHASSAYLPSSFAMYTSMLGFSAFMEGRGDKGTTPGIFWFACGALLGWPFAGALIIPFLFEQAWLILSTGDLWSGFKRVFHGAVRSLALLALQTSIDSLFYRKLVCVPLNIVLYNVFSGGNKGPNIYGVEPWHYYIRNLAINFNLWFFLALVAFPLLLLHNISRQKPALQQKTYRPFVFMMPFYLWLGIFTLQPHKEERFMYPAYPALALNAAIAMHVLLTNLGSTDPNELASRIPAQLKLLVTMVAMMASVNIGALRTIGLMTAYSAPLSIYAPLQHQSALMQVDESVTANVCLGKEWYRFPSSFLLPDNMRGRFIKSEFTGLLPGAFMESQRNEGLFPGTWIIPEGMNDENRENPRHYSAIETCDFLIDSSFGEASSSALEPDYISQTSEWEKLACSTFLDAGQTHLLGRLIWIPNLPIVPERYQRKWGRYCLLRNKAPVKEIETDGSW